MPEIFSKDCKIKVIEYGDNCSSFPLFDAAMIRFWEFLGVKK